MALSAFNDLFASHILQPLPASSTSSSDRLLGYRLTCPDPARLPYPRQPILLDLPHPTLGTSPAYFVTPWCEWLRLCPTSEPHLLPPVPSRRLRNLLLSQVLTGRPSHPLACNLSVSPMTPRPIRYTADLLYAEVLPDSPSLALLRALLFPTYSVSPLLLLLDPSAPDRPRSPMPSPGSSEEDSFK